MENISYMWCCGYYVWSKGFLLLWASFEHSIQKLIICTSIYFLSQRFPVPLPLSFPPFSLTGLQRPPFFPFPTWWEIILGTDIQSLLGKETSFDTCKECRLVLEILVGLNQQPIFRNNSKSTRVLKKSRGINNQD